MSSLDDVEALLESAAKAPQVKAEPHRRRDDDRHRESRHERRERDSHRHGSRDRDRDRKQRDGSRGSRGEHDGKSDRGSLGDKGNHKRSRTPSADRHRSHRHYRSRYETEDRDRDRPRDKGRERDPEAANDRERDRYRDRNRDRYADRERDRDRDRDRYGGSGRYSRDHDDNRYRGSDRRDRDRDDRRRDDRAEGRRENTNENEPKAAENGHKSPSESGKPADAQPTEDERDRRTVFVQQLAQRLRTKELIAFFEKVGPVKEAQIVKDRVSGRSKGVGYVEFMKEETVQAAIDLTGQKLLAIPIIVQLTEAEKNRQARTVSENNRNPNSIPFHRLYVGNIHFSITESDLQNVFEPFGELEFVQLQKEEMGRSRGYGFVQFRDPNQAREALEKMNGFDLAGRPIRVGLGNDKFTPETTANLLSRFQGGQDPSSGGQGRLGGGSSANFDRAGRADNEKGAGGASALDDTDVAGVNFSNYSRDALMRKLARTDEPKDGAANGDDKAKNQARAKVESKPAMMAQVPQASRCVLLKNMFDPAEEEGDSWPKELEEDVKAEADEKYGKVVHIHLDPSTQGDIYIKFEKVTGGENAIKGLNGRFFGGRQISATPVVDAVYSSLFARTKAL